MPRPDRPPLLARLRLLLALPALLALVCGVLSGLARLGLPMPTHIALLIGVHGALMVGSFFGTLIGLERAVALGRGWPYLAPLFSGLSLPAMMFAPPLLAPLLMSLAAAVMTLACFSVWRQQREAHLATLAVAAFAWLLGNLAWAVTGAVPPAVPLWAAFLILTIAGERLELSRFVPTPPPARRLFRFIVAGLMLAALLAVATPLGLRLFALTLFALAAWLLRYDIARRTVRTRGLTRYMAVCLLSGYVWLGIAAALGLVGALQAGSPLRDASLHALMLGFVFAMVFGHAPVILPAVTRLKMRWHAGFYLPLLILHASVLLRVLAGLTGSFALRQQAGIGNALTLALFLLTVAASVLAARRTHIVEVRDGRTA